MEFCFRGMHHSFIQISVMIKSQNKWCNIDMLKTLFQHFWFWCLLVSKKSLIHDCTQKFAVLQIFLVYTYMFTKSYFFWQRYSSVYWFLVSQGCFQPCSSFIGFDHMVNFTGFSPSDGTFFARYVFCWWHLVYSSVEWSKQKLILNSASSMIFMVLYRIKKTFYLFFSFLIDVRMTWLNFDVYKLFSPDSNLHSYNS